MTGLGNESNVEEDLDRDRFDAVWWRIRLAVAGELASEAEIDLAMVVEAGVRGPQSKECLCNAF